MDLGTYLSSVETAKSFAEKLGITPVQVSHWKTGFRPVPIEHCAEIERLTQGRVSRKELRPKDWLRIWPELANRSDSPAPLNSVSSIPDGLVPGPQGLGSFSAEVQRG